MRQAKTKNKEQTKALPCAGVDSKDEGERIIVLVGSAGYGELKGRYILAGFYNDKFAKDSQGMVERIYVAGDYLNLVRDWVQAKKPVEEFPKQPFERMYYEDSGDNQG